ncbi:hypothetical protein KKB40_02050 [Patescibacteria group bacterium]|nr:hypothetical protein [Patescibacteria group bacterium]
MSFPHLKKFPSPLLVIILSMLIILFFSFPTYHAYKNTPEKMVFSGQAFWFDPWDVNVYVSAIRWSQSNGLNFQNAYTTQEHKSITIYPFYTTLGILFPKINPFFLYHVSLISFSFLLLFTIYKIARKFLPKKSNALLALFLIPLGGGIGWLFFPKAILPDVGLTPFTFANSFQRPHEVLAVTFWILSHHLFYQGIVKKNIKSTVISALIFNLLIFFYPFYLLSYYLVNGIFSAIQSFKNKTRLPLLHFGAAVLITFPVGILYSLHLLSSASFESVLSPSLPTPNIVLIVFGYGILTPFLIYQLFQKKKDSISLYLIIWFFLSVLLAYLPISFAKYYLRGLFFPAIILFLKNIDEFSKQSILKRKLTKFIIVLIPITSFLIFAFRIVMVNDSKNCWYYLSREESGAMNFLNQNTLQGSGVLSSYPIGNHLPAHTDNRVYYGHNHQTPNSKEKIENLNKFYANEYSDDEAEKFIEENNISYVWWGQDEKKIANEHGEENLKYPFLKLVYTNSGVMIFRTDFAQNL